MKKKTLKAKAISCDLYSVYSLQEILIILGLITAIGADVSDLFAHSNNLQEDGYHYDRPVGYVPFPIYSKYDSPQSDLLEYKKRPVVPQYELTKLQPSSKQDFLKYETIQLTGQKPLQYVSNSDADKPVVPIHKSVGTTVPKFNTPKPQLTISKFDEPKLVIPKYEAAQQSTPKYDVPKFQSTKSLFGVSTPVVPKYEALQPSLSEHNVHKPQSILTKYEFSEAVIANPDIPRPFAPKYEAAKHDSVTTNLQVSNDQFTNYDSPKPFSFTDEIPKAQISSFATVLDTIKPKITEHDIHKSSLRIDENSKPVVPKSEIPKPKPITGKQAVPRSEVTNYVNLNPKYETQHFHPLRQQLQEQTPIISKNDIFTYDKSKPPKTGELREDGYHYEIPQKIFEIAKPVIPATPIGQQKLNNEYSPLVPQSTTALPDITTNTLYVVKTVHQPRPISQSAVALATLSPTNNAKTTVVITPKPILNAVPKYKPILTPAKAPNAQKPQVPAKIANEHLSPKEHIASQFKVQQTPVPFTLPTIPTLPQISVGTKLPFIAKESIITVKPSSPAKVINEYLLPQKPAVPDKEQPTQRPIAATTSVYKPISKVTKANSITKKPEDPVKLTNEYLPPQSVVPTKLGLTQRPVIAATTPAYQHFSEVTSYSKKPQISTEYTNEYLSPQKPVTPVKVEPTKRPVIVATFPTYKPVSEVTKFTNTPKKPEVPVKFTKGYLPPAKPVIPLKVLSTQQPLIIPTTSAYKPSELPVNFTNEYLPPLKPVGPLKVDPTQRPVVPTTTAYKLIPEVTKFFNAPKIPEVPAKFTNEYLPPAKPVVPLKVETTQRPIIAATIPAYKPPEVPVKITNEYLPPAKPVVPLTVDTTQQPIIAATIPAYKPVSQITQFSNTPKESKVPDKITIEYLPPAKPVVPLKVETTQRPIIAATIPAYKPVSQITQFSNTPKKPEVPAKFTNEYLPPAKPLKVDTTEQGIIAATIPVYSPAPKITQFSSIQNKPEILANFTSQYLPPAKSAVPLEVKTTQRPTQVATIPVYKPISKITQFSNTPKKTELPIKFTNEYLRPVKPVVPLKEEITQLPTIVATIPANKPILEITKISSKTKGPNNPSEFTSEYLRPSQPIRSAKVQTTQQYSTTSLASGNTQFSVAPKKLEVSTKFISEYVPSYQPVQATQRPTTVAVTPTYNSFLEVAKNPLVPAKFSKEYLPPQKTIAETNVQPTLQTVAAITTTYKPISLITKSPIIKQTPTVTAKVVDKYLPPKQRIIAGNNNLQTTPKPVIPSASKSATYKSVSSNTKNTPFIQGTPPKVNYDYVPPNRSLAVTPIPLVPFKAVTDRTEKANSFDNKYIPPTQKNPKAIPKVSRTQSKKPITYTAKSGNEKVTSNIEIINNQSKPESTKVTKTIRNKQIARTTQSPILYQVPVKQFEKVSKLPAEPTNQARPLIQVSKSSQPGQPNNQYLPPVTKISEPSHSPSALLKHKPVSPIARAPAPSYKPSQLNNEYLPPATKIPESAHSSSLSAKPNPIPNKTALVKPKPSIPANKSKQQLPATLNPSVNTAITAGKPVKQVIGATAKIEHLPTITKSTASTAIIEKPKKGYETPAAKPLLRVNPTLPLQTAGAVIVTPNLPHQGYFYPNNPQPPFTF
uniref:Uncharacterized protein n=1 Tax=Glossina austeni TaxID=7395 RepID=A0A1A9V497_GLOAU